MAKVKAEEAYLMPNCPTLRQWQKRYLENAVKIKENEGWGFGRDKRDCMVDYALASGGAIVINHFELSGEKGFLFHITTTDSPHHLSPSPSSIL
ncbi:unnamed protein product [Lupinus luteus]|uniref:Uncharacterized protein n=1 Tax=Lupinus luteus TaxID=3873 RepID=A0AAV1XCM8_LUPLU